MAKAAPLASRPTDTNSVPAGVANPKLTQPTWLVPA